MAEKQVKNDLKAMCFEFNCKQGEIYVKILNKEFKCTDKQDIEVSGFSGKIQCPPKNILCDMKYFWKYGGIQKGIAVQRNEGEANSNTGMSNESKINSKTNSKINSENNSKIVSNIISNINSKADSKLKQRETPLKPIEVYNMMPRIKNYSYDMVKYLSRFAKFAYCSNRDVDIGIGICPLLLGVEWKVIQMTDFVKVIKSDKFKKIVLACSSSKPKRLSKIPKNFEKSELVDYDTSSSTVKIEKYYDDMNLVSDEKEMEIFNQLKQNSDYQLIFVGHSLGAGVCNIIANRAVDKKYIEIGADSPVLLTLGQSVIGNKDFIDLTKRNIPIIFRILRRQDAVATYPRKAGDKYSNSLVYPKYIGDFYIFKEFKTSVIDKCFLENNTTLDVNPCGVFTEYSSYNNKFYLRDNITGINPKSEYNKVWAFSSLVKLY